MDLLDIEGNVVESKSSLETSVKCQKMKMLTLNASVLRSHTGMFQNMPVGSLDPGVDVEETRLNL